MQCDPKQKKNANVATGIQVRDCGASNGKYSKITLANLRTTTDKTVIW